MEQIHAADCSRLPLLLEQTTDPTTEGTPNQETNPQYGGCVGKTGKPFADEHSYFQTEKSVYKSVRENTERMKVHLPYNRTIKTGRQTIFINDFADLDDLKPNIEAAKITAELLQKDIYIRPHVNFVEGYSNPELGIGTQNLFADLKTMSENSKNFFNSRMRAASMQGCKMVVMNIDNFDGDISELQTRVKSGFEHNGKPKNESIEKIIIIRNGKAIQLTRKQAYKDLFNDLKKLL